jgi:hypothetical protein
MTFLSLALSTLALANCQLGGSGTEQNDVEAATSGVLEMVSADSSMIAGASGGANSTSALVMAAGLARECGDPASVTKSRTCDDAAGTGERSVELIDCEVTNRFGDWSGDGIFEKSVSGGAAGMCKPDASINAGIFVTGSDPVYVRKTDPNIVWVRTDTENDVTVTRDTTRTEAFSAATDADEDGIAEEATSSIEIDGSFVHLRNGKEIHNLKISTEDGELVSTDGDGIETIIGVSKPISVSTFDETGAFTGRTVNGDYLVEHHRGATFYHYNATELKVTPDSCLPVGGTLKIVGYDFDGVNVGEKIGDWEGEFDADGDLIAVTKNGEELRNKRLHPRPCVPE